MSLSWAKNKQGFTIVELLIVIVVIGILASVTLVAYNGIQSRARDSHKKQDVGQIAKLIVLYDSDNGPMWTGSNCGNGSGNGWFNYTYSGYTSSNQCLINAGVTNAGVVGAKITCATGSTQCDAYMKYTCAQNGHTVTYVFANLETLAHNDTSADGTCASSIDTNFGMNYYVKVTDQ